MNLRRTLFGAALAALASGGLPAQPAPTGIVPLSDLKPGEQGEVWTVFRGTRPEPFSVQVTGVVRNALGPGKSLILCQLTDPRVQRMGAVAGMSGSPLYIGGRLAGALSYKILPFESVPYAGFTPAADLAEVGRRVDESATGGADLAGGPAEAAGMGFEPLRPVFTLSGLSPATAGLMSPYFRRLGLDVVEIGGGGGSPAAQPAPAEALRPGDAVSVALATGDITLAGTGTVSEVDGDRLIAFGHPMMGLGNVDLPMCSADIVTILPSALESIKVANTGPVIGTITQDRLSAVSGLLGRTPKMIAVQVTVLRTDAGPRVLHFQVARQEQLTPAVIAAGLTEAIMGSNDAGLSNGFRIESDLAFSARENLSARTFYAGPQAFAQGLGDFVQGLSQDLENPYERTFPERVTFTVQPLEQNPAVTLDRFELSRQTARPGDVVEAEVDWRDYQGAEHRRALDIAIDPTWAGRSLEVVLAPGRILDELTGRSHQYAAAQFRSFGAYLAAVQGGRSNDGLYLAVIGKSSLFSDQNEAIPDLPGSFARIAGAADEARFQDKPALLPLWERHLLPGKVSNAVFRRALQVDP